MAESERQTARSVDKGHGRLEVRTLVATTQLDGDYLEFPGVAQCFKITHGRTLTDRAAGEKKTTVETVCGITSLSREQADAGRPMAVVRKHWWIENKVFHVRDQTPDEDACRVRKNKAPAIFSTLRNDVLNLPQTTNVKNWATRLRTFCANPVKALQAVHRRLTENWKALAIDVGECTRHQTWYITKPCGPDERLASASSGGTPGPPRGVGFRP